MNQELLIHVSYWPYRMLYFFSPACGEPEERHRLPAGGCAVRLSGLRRVLVPGLLALCCVGVFADVRETPHNLIKSRDKSVSEKQVCVFCHTPLNDPIEIPLLTGDSIPDKTGPVMAPRWQKALTDGFIFTIYDDIGRLGLGKPSVGSASIACLSCHDSNQALLIGRTSSDHPFGVPYRGATKNMVAGAQVTTPKRGEALPFREAMHLQNLDDFRDVSEGTVENRTVYWVSGAGVTARRSRNDLPLYGRTNDTGNTVMDSGLVVPHIECASCHDPHTTTQTFLRVPPGGSMLCLTCHDK